MPNPTTEEWTRAETICRQVGGGSKHGLTCGGCNPIAYGLMYYRLRLADKARSYADHNLEALNTGRVTDRGKPRVHGQIAAAEEIERRLRAGA